MKGQRVESSCGARAEQGAAEVLSPMREVQLKTVVRCEICAQDACVALWRRATLVLCR